MIQWWSEQHDSIQHCDFFLFFLVLFFFFYCHDRAMLPRGRLRVRFPPLSLSLPLGLAGAEISSKKACNWQSHVFSLRERAQPARERMRAKERERERERGRQRERETERERGRSAQRWCEWGRDWKGRQRDMTKISKGRKHAVPCELNWWPMGSRMSD